MLTLNDEQEKALRRWWAEIGGAEHWCYGSSVKSMPNNGASPELAYAIAPLMRPWRVEPGPYVTNGGRAMAVGGTGSDELAQRICDLLNESEARK